MPSQGKRNGRWLLKPRACPYLLRRREQALSQRDLSRMTGIAHDSISQLETGKREAQPLTIRKLASALGVEPRELMKGDNHG
jgi:transcriptional regulator with XRE-family HTH domain